MVYQNCTTSLIINGQLSWRVDVGSSVRQGCLMSPLLFLFLEPLYRKILGISKVHGLQGHARCARILAYADDAAIFATDRESVRNALCITQSYYDTSGSVANRHKCLGVWHGAWDEPRGLFDNIQWDTVSTKCLGVPLNRYREDTHFWHKKAQEACIRIE